MKKLLSLTAACLLLSGSAFAGQPNEADQKWLQVVEKKIESGQNQISTPAQTRVDLLKQWAKSNGYKTEVTKADTGFRVEVTRQLAQK